MSMKTYNRFKAMGYDLRCKICIEKSERGDFPIEQAAIKPFDEVESKASGKGPKLYHAECYDEYHLDFPDDDTETLKYDDDDEEGDEDAEEK